MRRKRIVYYIIMLIVVLSEGTHAQLSNVIGDLFSSDTTKTEVPKEGATPLINESNGERKLKEEQALKLDSLHQATLKQLKTEEGRKLWLEDGKRAVYFLLVVIGQFLLYKLVSWLYKKTKIRIRRLKDTRLKPLAFQDYELLNTQKQVNLLIFFASIMRYILLAVLLLITIPILFSIFPQTKELAYQILYYIWDPLRSILMAIVDYIPNLFTIVVICVVVKYVVKLIYYLATEIEASRLKISGFYPDWAMPTYHIVRFFLYAFMIAMIYPYLPGSKSGVFQGISVFVGLIISLGSSSVISNIIAGFVITYMRPFKLGDRIQLNNTIGNVIEKTSLVTRVRTLKNEVVTIPNSFIMSSHTVNYSASARDYGLIIHAEVTIGYSTSWRTIHQLLIDSALATNGIQQDPTPFVLETSLSDFYPVYQINAFIKEADQMQRIYSELFQNIQDHFAKAGVEIMSPHYTAFRNGNEPTIPTSSGMHHQ